MFLMLRLLRRIYVTYADIRYYDILLIAWRDSIFFNIRRDYVSRIKLQQLFSFKKRRRRMKVGARVGISFMKCLETIVVEKIICEYERIALFTILFLDKRIFNFFR